MCWTIRPVQGPTILVSCNKGIFLTRRYTYTKTTRHMEDSVCRLYIGYHKSFLFLMRRTCLTLRGNNQQDEFPLTR